MKKIRKPDNDIEPILNNCIMRMKIRERDI